MMYKIKKGKVMRGVDTVSPNVLISQLNKIEEYIDKHDVNGLAADLRTLSDWFETMQNKDLSGITSKGVMMYSDPVALPKPMDNLHKVANLLSAITREVQV